jgi:hypothetical protein
MQTTLSHSNESGTSVKPTRLNKIPFHEFCNKLYLHTFLPDELAAKNFLNNQLHLSSLKLYITTGLYYLESPEIRTDRKLNLSGSGLH